MRSVQSTLFALLAASSAACADTTLNLTQGVSPISHDVYELHMTVFWICVVIGIIVFGAMFYAMIFHRKSRGAIPANFHSHPFLEIGWTIVPAIILVLLAIPSTKVLLNMNNTDQEALTIKITGYQWKWHYEYIEDDVRFFSNLSTPPNQMKNLEPKGEYYLREVDNPLVLPIHKKIRFLITSNDVNHAWWVPDFGVKRDAIAGFINEAWTVINKPGTYRGQCAELCGINHAFMPIVVVATTEQGYKDFIAKQKGQATQGEALINKLWTLQELMDQGEKVYGRICSACHQPTGLGLPPTFPAMKGSPVATGAIEKHIETVMNGVSGTAMQAFKSQLTDAELASIITYERNAFGNNTGSLIQPIQIKAIRDGKSVAEALTIKPSGEVTSTTAASAPTAPSASAPPSPASSSPSKPKPAVSSPVPASVPTAASPSAPTAVQPSAVTKAPVPAAPVPQSATVSKTAAGTSITVTPVANETTTVTITMTPSGSASPPPTTPNVPDANGATPQATGTPPSASSPPTSAPVALAAPPSQTTAPTAPAVAASPVDAIKTAMERGEKVYLTYCGMCHQPTGVGMPPTFPSLKGSPIATGPVAAHLNIVLNGKPGTAMLPFKDQLKSDQDLADVITYERNAFGNNTGTLVKPDEVKAVRLQGQTK